MKKRNVLICKTVATFMVAAVFALTVGITGCSPQAVSDTEKQDSGKETTAVTTAWSEASDCGMCHTAESDSATDSSTLYSLHSAHDSYSECIDCHTDEGGALSKAHEKYADPKTRLPQRLKKTAVSEDTCLTSGCHSMNELIAATAATTVLTDANGTVVNPHEMLTNENHIAKSNSNLACSSCHKMHAENGVEPETTDETARETCTSCHHQNVYECGTCHD